MRSFPLMLVKEQLTQAVLIDETELIPCGMIATSMLDLPAYRGILASQLTEPSLSQRQRQWCLHLLNLPTAIYFHENQLTFPRGPSIVSCFVQRHHAGVEMVVVEMIEVVEAAGSPTTPLQTP